MGLVIAVALMTETMLLVYIPLEVSKIKLKLILVKINHIKSEN